MKYLGRFFAVLLLSFGLQWLGAWCNQVAVAANGGRMPVIVFTQGIEMTLTFDPDHSALNVHTRYKVLCDIVPIPFLQHANIALEVISFGDICLESGETLLLVLPILPFLFLWGWLRRKHAKGTFHLASSSSSVFGRHIGSSEYD
jgi:hypothetical protein